MMERLRELDFPMADIQMDTEYPTGTVTVSLTHPASRNLTLPRSWPMIMLNL
ncbi:MAG: hypothetical protein R2860_10710 [Desulfobacterales bacterium]